MANEVGALTCRLTFVLGDSWSFPATTAAREECACGDRAPAAARQEKRPPAWPSALYDALVTQYERPDDEYTQCLDAVIALAGAVGLPITLAASMTMDEVSVELDAAARREGLIIGVKPRGHSGGGRKVERRRAAAPKAPPRAVWTASSSATAAARFIPWMRLRLDAPASTFLFPRYALVGPDKPRRRDESAHISTRAVADRLRQLLGDETQFHDIRRGVENALELVHKVIDGVSEPSKEVKNTIGLRSNAALRGSRDAYVRDTVDALFAATRHLHLVKGSVAGGLLRARAPRAGPDLFATDCQRCGTHIPVDASGALCDKEGCRWCLCIKCFPGNEELLCPRHENGASSDDEEEPDAESASGSPTD
jgi:hypothetical protein